MKTIQNTKGCFDDEWKMSASIQTKSDTILTSIIAPILTMLLFAYVIGGAMQTSETSYVNFIVPGSFCNASDSVPLPRDCRLFRYKKRNPLERFCTMPVKTLFHLNWAYWELL